MGDESRSKENREYFLKSTIPSENLPKSITKAAKLLYASLIISVITTVYVQFFIGVVTGCETVVENGVTFTVEKNVTYTGLFPTLMLIGFYSIFFLFIQQIGMGKNWARIIMLVLFFISAPFTIVGLPRNLLSEPLAGGLSII